MALGLTQIELANELGCDQSSVSGWELGKIQPTLTTIQKLAQFFQVSIDELVRD